MVDKKGILVIHSKWKENPDYIAHHKVTECSYCGSFLENIEACYHKKRQVFEIPPVKIEVTEHQAEIKICSHCKTVTTASFPPDINSSVQYGKRIKSLAIYLNTYNFIPLERTSDFFENVFVHRISQATILKAVVTKGYSFFAWSVWEWVPI